MNGQQMLKRDFVGDLTPREGRTRRATAIAAKQAAGSPVTLVTIGAVFWTTILAAIAAVGIYVIRIYKDVRNRPQYIVESTIGLSQAAEEAPAERALP